MVIGTSYTVTATNEGCTSAVSTTFTNLIQLTTPAIPTLSSTAPTCLADGFTTITNYNAANTYTSLTNRTNSSVGGSISGMVIGTSYTVTASNGGCTSAVSTGVYQFGSIDHSGSSNSIYNSANLYSRWVFNHNKL